MAEAFRSEHHRPAGIGYCVRGLSAVQDHAFQTLFTQAQLQGMPNRAAYIGQLVSWTEAIAVAAITGENQINACTTVDEVNAVTLGTIPADRRLPSR